MRETLGQQVPQIGNLGAPNHGTSTCMLNEHVQVDIRQFAHQRIVRLQFRRDGTYPCNACWLNSSASSRWQGTCGNSTLLWRENKGLKTTKTYRHSAGGSNKNDSIVPAPRVS